MKKSAHLLWGLMLVLIAGLVGWAVRSRGPAVPTGSVTRAEVLALAERYVQHVWRGGPEHIFHGLDPQGVRVDTPDAAFQPQNGQGWWRTDVENVGIPYKWGGFDLPEEFATGLRAGRYAGDCGSAEKRRLLDDAVSSSAVGIDCSGFVSRCWKLPRSYSTRELPQLCDPITDLTKLEPGDIFNRHNAHVMLFAGWVDADHTLISVYEANEKVSRTEHAVAKLLQDGFSAWRYREMRD